MSIQQLAVALTVLREAITGKIPQGAAHVLLEIMASCCALLVILSEKLRESTDPRIAAGHARILETHYRHILREQHRTALHVESTGAHLLEDGELIALTDDTVDYSRPARQHKGRAHYQNTGEFLSGWLGINAFEGLNRVRDAHLLIGRRAIDGSLVAPRFAKLAALYKDSETVDPRVVARAVRALDKFEPADTCFEGLPLPPVVRNEAGQLLEDQAVELLAEPDRVTREASLNAMLSAERKLRKSEKVPEPGMFLQRTVGELDFWQLVVGGADREVLRSSMAQADNPRSEAGKSARQPNQEQNSNQEDVDQGQTGDGGFESRPGDGTAFDELFSSNDPAPPWAGLDDEAAEEDTADINATEELVEASAGTAEDSDVAEPEGDAADFEDLDDESTSEQSEDLEDLEDLDDPEDPVDSSDESDTKDGLPVELRGDGDVPVPLRRLNALLAVLRQRQTGSGLKTIAPKVVVHVNLDQIQDLKNPKKDLEKQAGRTEHGVKLDSAEVSRLMCEGEIYRVIFGPDGQPLDVGRQGRFFTEAMKRAIYARDGGCIVPGCSAPPEMLEYHHVQWWERGGCTSVRNGCCLCRRHHHAVHAGLLTLVSLRGLVHVLLPRHVDPLQVPRRNALQTI